MKNGMYILQKYIKYLDDNRVRPFEHYADNFHYIYNEEDRFMAISNDGCTLIKGEAHVTVTENKYFFGLIDKHHQEVKWTVEIQNVLIKE
jgi:hypothetical protein